MSDEFVSEFEASQNPEVSTSSSDNTSTDNTGGEGNSTALESPAPAEGDDDRIKRQLGEIDDIVAGKIPFSDVPQNHPYWQQRHREAFARKL